MTKAYAASIGVPSQLEGPAPLRGEKGARSLLSVMIKSGLPIHVGTDERGSHGFAIDKRECATIEMKEAFYVMMLCALSTPFCYKAAVRIALREGLVTPQPAEFPASANPERDAAEWEEAGKSVFRR